MFKSAAFATTLVSVVLASDGHKHGNTSAYGHRSGDHKAASDDHSAAVSGHDNDEHATQSYGQDTDFAWGKSYDSVKANSYDDEQYERATYADDDYWAEDYDDWSSADADEYGEAASEEKSEGDKVTVTVTKGKIDGKSAAVAVAIEEDDDEGHYLDGFDIPSIPQTVHSYQAGQYAPTVAHNNGIGHYTQQHFNGSVQGAGYANTGLNLGHPTAHAGSAYGLQGSIEGYGLHANNLHGSKGTGRDVTFGRNGHGYNNGQQKGLGELGSIHAETGYKQNFGKRGYGNQGESDFLSARNGHYSNGKTSYQQASKGSRYTQPSRSSYLGNPHAQNGHYNTEHKRNFNYRAPTVSRYNSQGYGAKSYGAQSYGNQSYGNQSYGAQSYGNQSYGAPSYGVGSPHAQTYSQSNQRYGGFQVPAYQKKSYGGHNSSHNSGYGQKKSSYSPKHHSKSVGHVSIVKPQQSYGRSQESYGKQSYGQQSYGKQSYGKQSYGNSYGASRQGYGHGRW